MNKFMAFTLAAFVGLIFICSMTIKPTTASYGASYGHGGYSAPSYGQNYERKTGFKTVIYHPYGGVSNRFDYRTYPAYGDSYGHPAPYIKTGLEYSIGNGYQSSY